MRIPEEEVLRVARLAALEVRPEELAPLTRELDAIVEYVAQLAEVSSASIEGPPVGPSVAPLRPDQVRPTGMRVGPGDLAADFRDGFFVVPRLEAMDG